MKILCSSLVYSYRIVFPKITYGAWNNPYCIKINHPCVDQHYCSLFGGLQIWLPSKFINLTKYGYFSNYATMLPHDLYFFIYCFTFICAKCLINIESNNCHIFHWQMRWFFPFNYHFDCMQFTCCSLFILFLKTL